MGSGELTHDKPTKKGVRSSNTSELHDGGIVDDSGNSNPSGTGGFQLAVTEDSSYPSE